MIERILGKRWIADLFNPHHEPGGSSIGGQFARAADNGAGMGGGASEQSDDEKTAEANTAYEERKRKQAEERNYADPQEKAKALSLRQRLSTLTPTTADHTFDMADAPNVAYQKIVVQHTWKDNYPYTVSLTSNGQTRNGIVVYTGEASNIQFSFPEGPNWMFAEMGRKGSTKGKLKITGKKLETELIQQGRNPDTGFILPYKKYTFSRGK